MSRVDHSSIFPGGVDPNPASPTRLPVVSFTLTCDRRFLIKNYSAMYAARKFFDFVSETYQFKQTTNIEGWFGESIKFKSAELDDILEYEYKRSEELWELPDQDKRAFLQLIGQAVEPRETPREAPVSRERSTRIKVEEGDTRSLQSICEAIGVDPKHARNHLRKINYPKPASGSWIFNLLEVESVSKAIKEGLKK